MNQQHEEQLFKILTSIRRILHPKIIDYVPLIDIKNSLLTTFNDKISSVLINNLKYRKCEYITEEYPKRVTYYVMNFVTVDDIYHQFYITYDMRLCWDLYLVDKGLTK